MTSSPREPADQRQSPDDPTAPAPRLPGRQLAVVATVVIVVVGLVYTLLTIGNTDPTIADTATSLSR